MYGNEQSKFVNILEQILNKLLGGKRGKSCYIRFLYVSFNKEIVALDILDNFLLSRMLKRLFDFKKVTYSQH